MATLQPASDAFVFSMNLVGGALCFDFTNSLDGRGGSDANVIEYLRDYSDLLAWGQHTQVLSEREATLLAAEATRHPDVAAQAFRHAIALRETLYRLFAAIAHSHDSTPTDLAALNDVLATAMQHASVSPTPAGFMWGWQAVAPTELERIIWPVARSAAVVLTDAATLQHVHECPGTDCSWLFVDTSKSHRRRWCTMDSCGNRAKARRHYSRRRSEDETA